MVMPEQSIDPRFCLEHTYHAPPAAWLGELVGCSCGHGIGRHSVDGCSGRPSLSCRCRYNPTDVLARAIRDARQQCEVEASLL
jgi:hypothetical protein